MPYSQNGFYASSDPQKMLIADFKVPGTSINFPQGIASFAAPLLIWMAEQIHERVEPLRDGWCWGYYYRPVTGETSTLSNHASGTAIDVNAPEHGYGVHNSWSSAQVAEIRRILAEANRYARVVAWGEDFPTPDGMHFECRGTKDQVMAAGKRLTQRDWFDMASKADLAAVIEAKLREMEPYIHRVVQEAVQAELGNEGALVAKQTWGYQLPDPLSTATPAKTYAAGSWLRGRDSALNRTADRIIAALKH